ncbi:hypothetical protein NP493_1087g00063 [Ridgeia piscesae]|uniref:ubiquitinyl hydrolase 1 n=1 Tax=Ridgeia piscesae TaxID=27915 RepID=A0AAD9KH38_RIDPI|nr:hypothetical protein NP493_1087g00063 [Ridgeia piscesae]
MECPHVAENVKVTPNNDKPFQLSPFCSVCKDGKNVWVCLTCGSVNCGRYVNAHAKAHFEANKPLHCVTMDCDSSAVFCYMCDEFVINDTVTSDIQQIREHLQTILSSSENSTKENQECRTRRSMETRENPGKRHRGKAGSSGDDGCTDGHNKRHRSDKDLAKLKLRTSGIRNLGNTCFMNAVLQSLSNIQSFCGYIKQLPSLEHQLSKKKITTRRLKDGEDVFVVEELRKTLVALWQGNKSAISPESLFSVIWKVVPRFRGYQQQDAHEFMRYLLDRLHSELLTLLPYPNSTSPYICPKGKSTIVTAIFGGILQSEVNCLVCGMESRKHDPFLDLSLDIPTKFTAKSAHPKNGEDVCSISDCLASFTEVEELEDSELYMCSNCKRRQKSTKKFWIRRLPNVLCLHLKRFRWQSCFRMKIDTYVSFPLRGLSMGSYVLNNLHETRHSSSGSGSHYDLAAVIVHHGSG